MTAIVLPRAPTICAVRDGRFVDACARVSREPFQLVQILDHRTRQPSRSCVVVVDEAGAMTPLVSCPFCGVEHRASLQTGAAVDVADRVF